MIITNKKKKKERNVKIVSRDYYEIIIEQNVLFVLIHGNINSTWFI